MRTDKEIKTELAKLRAIKKYVPRRTAFGDDNHESIDFQIEVLEKKLSEDDVYNRCHREDEDDGRKEDDSLLSSNTLDAALSARRWLDADGEESPSTGWADFAPKKTKTTKKK